MNKQWTVYGSELSPFTLKLLAMARYKGLPHRFLPEEGGWLDNLRITIRKERLVRRKLPLTWPRMTEDDEFPLVPFLFGPDGENLYDSSAVGEWLDQRGGAPTRLIPEEPALRFVVKLLDEFADEWMLYLVHHYRWKVSATDNNAGARLGHELRWTLLGRDAPVANFFSARQVRRLPYLFSVAPPGFHIPGLPPERQPPSREGFPPTHALLEDSYRRILLALEPVFSRRPYLFGDAPTLADFSLYGQIGMNLPDPSANTFIATTAPGVHEWVRRMHRGEFNAARDPRLALHEDLAPLLAEVLRVYVPLMQQNAAAFQRFKHMGETRFNERAFNRGQSLYGGELDGATFRSVAKSFQAKTWSGICAEWATLALAAREELRPLGLEATLFSDDMHPMK